MASSMAYGSHTNPKRKRGGCFFRAMPRLRLGLVCAAMLLSVPSAAHAQGPHWIGGTSVASKTWQFERSFSAEAAVQSAKLKLAADFCTARVLINDQPVLTVEPYCPTQDREVTRYLKRGKNKLSVVTTPVAGPAAVALSLTLSGRDGQTTTIVSDGSWQGAESHGEVRPELWGLGRRSAAVSPFDNYEQWQQAKGDKPEKPPQFWVVPGFEVTLVRKAAVDEGSWIALAFDAEGRATISREDTGLLRMTLAADRASVARVEHVEAALPECRGLLYRDGFLYVNANNAKAMYRLRISGEGKATNLQKLRDFPGGVGHGRNDLAFGRDGWLYSIHGDSVEAPGKPVVDRTSPLRESRREKPRQEGYVVRTDLDGKKWELFCTGLRNPYGIAMHPNGDLFTYDADNEYDMGTPWYRPTRIVQLSSGADYGWRVAQGQWPPRFPDRPDNGLPTIDVGRGSPTAVMFGTEVKYPAPYREALYVLDWAYGRVLAVHLAPRGAGYRAALELFMQGKPLNVTDVAAGPDGAMWLTTGGRKTQSALCRVAFTGRTTPRPEEGRHEREAAAFADEQRAVRSKLETCHGAPQDGLFITAMPRLRDADPLVRHAARIALEQLPAKELVKSYEQLIDERAPASMRSTTAVMECLTIAVRAGNAALVPKLVSRLLTIRAEELDLAAQFTLVFVYRECLALSPEATNEKRDEIVEQLGKLWPEPSRNGLRVSPFGDSLKLRRRLALLLADLEDPGVVDRVTCTLLASAVQEDRLQGLLALRSTRTGWTPDTRRVYFSTLRDASRFVGGEGMPTFLDRLRKDAVATLGEDEKSLLAELLAPPKIEDEPLPSARPKVQAWSLDDLDSLAGEKSPRGSAERGAKIFQDALCSRCHRAGLIGPAVGPDLSFVARRFSRRDMLESIIAPARSVAENYRNVVVVTVSGEVHVGRVLNEGDFRREKLKLNVDPLRPARIVEVDKKEIAEERVHESSPMPNGLLDTFTCDEIADLLAFLEEGVRGSP